MSKEKGFQEGWKAGVLADRETLVAGLSKANPGGMTTFGEVIQWIKNTPPPKIVDVRPV